MTIYRTVKTPKQYTNMLEMPCKIGVKSGYNMRYTKHSPNKKKPLITHVKKVKIRPLSVPIRVQKWKQDRPTNHAKMGIKREIQHEVYKICLKP